MSEEIASESLSKIFELSDSDPCTLARAEDETVEYKKSFSFDDQLMKTCAAFANSLGGHIIHGIEDSTRKLVGLTDTKVRDFERFDLAEATLKLNARFAPKITIRMQVHEVGGLNFGVIRVYESEDKPVIAISEGRAIREGDIFYSYGALRTRIKYADLQILFDNVVQRKVTQLFKHVDMIAKIGVDNAAIMDSVRGTVFGPSIKSFVISEDLVDQLKIVKEGEFTEKEGAPTLKLIGNLQTYDEQAKIEVRMRISEDDIYAAFLNQGSVDSPLQYIEASCDQLSPYFPIYYYAVQAGLELHALHEFVANIPDARQHTRERILCRITEEKRLREKHSVTKSKAFEYRENYRQNLISESELDFDVERATYLISAIRTLSRDEIKADHVLHALTELFDRREELQDIQKSNLRKAICHIDYALNGYAD